jgi:transposase InsO family protein
VTGARLSIGIGSKVVRDGGLCEVIELQGDTVVVEDARGRAAQVRVVDLLAAGGDTGIRLAGSEQAASLAEESVGVLLGGAREEVVREALERAAHVREVLTGYRSGSAEFAAVGEPRAEFQSSVSLMGRYAAKARELGVSVATIRDWISRYRAGGEAGLADRSDRRGRAPLASVDPRWADACRAVLDEQVAESNVTKKLTLRRVAARLEREFGAGVVPAPRGGAAYRALEEIARGRGSFGTSAKARRSIANRPEMSYGRLRASRPGEYVLLDTTRLDVFAMEPVTLRWVQVELTIAMDLYTRCVTGLRCSPVSTKSVDVASVLFETIQPRPAPEQWPAEAAWPYHGLPSAVVVDADRVDGPRFSGPGLLPDTVVVDHGKVYLSDHVTSACARLGISVQPARPYTPTDKAPVERFFRSLREGLLEALPGYKGPDVFSRGARVEDEAFFYLGELDQIVREWIGTIYHRRPHDSLVDPHLPGLAMSPLQRFSHGVARAGRIDLPADATLALQLLPLRWRTIQHYGVEIDGLRYSGPVVAKYANRASGYKTTGAGRRGGKWPFAVDPDDRRRIYFQDPEDGTWHTLAWEHAADLDLPLSSDALAYAKGLAARGGGAPDLERALVDLLAAWNVGLAANRTERRIALRTAADRAALQITPPDDPAQLPAVRGLLLAQQLDAVDLSQPLGPPAAEDLGDDDSDDELDDAGGGGDFYADALDDAALWTRPHPAEETEDAGGEGGGDFYADALEVVE